jgi:hypothetical protein
MARMPTFDEIEADFKRGIRTAEQHIEHPFRHHADAATQTPASTPATMKAATAAAPQQEDTMSLATLEADLGDGVTAVKNEIARFEQNLPGYVAEVKKIAASPLGQLAVTGAEHVASGILPPEALAIVESGAVDLYNKILGLYSPQGAQQAPAAPVAPVDPQQPAVPA